MEAIIGILFLILLFMYFSKRKNNSKNITAYVDGKKIYQSPIENLNIKRDGTFPRAVEGSFDMSFFVSSEGKFKLPRYGTTKGAIVKIKDITDHKEFWRNYDSDQKKHFSMKDFELDIRGYNELDVEDFWSFIYRLGIDDLKPYQFLKKNIQELEPLVYEIEELNEEKNYIPQNNDLKRACHKNGVLSEYKFEDKAEKQKYYENHFSTLTVAELKNSSKNLNLKTTLKKADLVKQLVENMDLISIDPPLEKNYKFDEMIKYFGGKYITAIRNQIDTWHPFYIEAVWEAVDGSFPSEVKVLKEVIDKVMMEKYWEERIFFE